jgi:hypothetical protein
VKNAYKIGFSSPAYFSTVFKSKFGVKRLKLLRKNKGEEGDGGMADRGWRWGGGGWQRIVFHCIIKFKLYH